MKKNLAFLAVATLILALSSSSCKRGNTQGSFFDPMDGEHPVFDTFQFPVADYYFYGKFDGHYMKWQDGYRSKWDTARRIDPLNGDPYDQWPINNTNYYANFCEQEVLSECRYDSSGSYHRHMTEFIRPDYPEQRVEIYLYKCLGMFDTIPEYQTTSTYYNGEIITNLDIQTGAWPFTDETYGRIGAQLVYVDSLRNRWSTKSGSGQLLDSYFRITDFYKREVETDTMDTFAMYIVEGEFAGRLFNGGDQLPVTESKFRARLVARGDTLD